MDCPDCERIDDVMFPETYLWIWPPTDDSHAKVASLLGGEGFGAAPFGRLGVHARCRAEDGRRLAVLLAGALESEELAALKVVTTKTPDFRPEDLARFMSGAGFVARMDAGWLVSAIRENRYETWLQPIVTAAGGAFAHEALFRLREPNGDLVSPGRAFGIAKESGLLFNLDLIARRSAVETAARAGREGRLFINFNPSSIYDPAYCLRTTASFVDDLGMTPSDIVFEVTETEKARDIRHLKGILAFYRNAGFRVALDDIGSGYSSLNLLSEVRPDFMKIDMDLIRNVDAEPYKQNIVRNLFAIARGNGTMTVAEGIETDAERDWLLGEGVDYMQGYLFGPPAPAETLAPKSTPIAAIAAE